MIADDMYSVFAGVDELQYSAENHLKPVQLLLRGSDQDSVAVIYPGQNRTREPVWQPLRRSDADG